MTGMRVSPNPFPTEHDELTPRSPYIVTRVTKSQRQRLANLSFTRDQIESMANATRTRVRCFLF